MSVIPWWVAALGAAIIWGIHYPLISKALEHLSMYTVLLITITPLILMYPFFHHSVITDIQTFATLPSITQAMILFTMVTSVSAGFLVYMAIDGSNATLASLIEISYPLFVAIFSFILLRENHINLSVIIGGLLTIIGTGIIVIGNK